MAEDVCFFASFMFLRLGGCHDSLPVSLGPLPFFPALATVLSTGRFFWGDAGTGLRLRRSPTCSHGPPANPLQGERMRSESSFPRAGVRSAARGSQSACPAAV